MQNVKTSEIERNENRETKCRQLRLDVEVLEERIAPIMVEYSLVTLGLGRVPSLEICCQ